MLLTPAPLIVLATFPGVAVHELAHKMFCDLFGVRIYDISYFRLLAIKKGPLGYVKHAEPHKFLHLFLISISPLIINSGLSIMLSFFAAHAALSIPARLIFYWLAISIGVHAFPSNQDARNILARSKRHIANRDTLLHYLSYPLFWITCLANQSRRWSFNVLYSAALVSISSYL